MCWYCQYIMYTIRAEQTAENFNGEACNHFEHEIQEKVFMFNVTNDRIDDHDILIFGIILNKNLIF